jgi:hypothetical protein
VIDYKLWYALESADYILLEAAITSTSYTTTA